MSTSSSDQNQSHPHILVFPYPAQGHMLPLLDLTNQLALRSLTITIVITPKNLPTLTPLLSAHPSIETLVLPFPPHPKIPPGVENVKDLGTHGNLAVIDALSKLDDPIIRWFNSHPNPPVALISDFFLGHTLRLADYLKIPRITFFSSGAYLVSIHEYCWQHIDLVQSSSKVIDFPGLPRKPSLKKEHVPTIVLAYRGTDPESESFRVSMLANTESWGCIFNSFADVEGEYLNHLKRRVGHDRVYGVGPLNLIDAGNGGLDRGNLNTGTGGDLMAWLDGCPDGSVLYVCFGSQKLLNGKQMEALASGLERSGVRFVWVLKVGSAQETKEGYNVVPEGFEDRVAGRGWLVKGWAPQVMILGHRAVGGFVSHCGWNSVLEAIVGGVLILGWPMEADQYVNAKLLVEDMSVAIQVCEGANGVPDPVQLGRVIAESLSDDSAEKVRAQELRDKAFGAVKDGGSSLTDLNELVKELRQLRAAV